MSQTFGSFRNKRAKLIIFIISIIINQKFVKNFDKNYINKVKNLCTKYSLKIINNCPIEYTESRPIK